MNIHEKEDKMKKRIIGILVVLAMFALMVPSGIVFAAVWDYDLHDRRHRPIIS